MRGNQNGVTLILFGCIGGGLCAYDVRVLRCASATGKTRIAIHLTMMLAGAIATVTAFVVVNIRFSPGFVLWLAPTIVITPVIVWWNAKIDGGRKPRGMPDHDGDG